MPAARLPPVKRSGSAGVQPGAWLTDRRGDQQGAGDPAPARSSFGG